MNNEITVTAKCRDVVDCIGGIGLSQISHYPAVQQIYFYTTEASPELLQERRVYLENYLLPIWQSRLSEIKSWKEHSVLDVELLSVYQKAVDFLTQTLKQLHMGQTNEQTS